MISRGDIKNKLGGHMTGESVQLYSINNRMEVLSYSEELERGLAPILKIMMELFLFLEK
ncbi:Uncharacterised protein [Yersinia enterocolitica]|nr:Uncharacterised protein [Yersinia enterocolitica]